MILNLLDILMLAPRIVYGQSNFESCLILKIPIKIAFQNESLKKIIILRPQPLTGWEDGFIFIIRI